MTLVVIKDTAKLAETVRKVARELKSHRFDDINDLRQAANILERLAEEKGVPVDRRRDDLD